MNKDIIVEKIKYLTSLPHSALVEHCIYLENENDNYKAQKYITDLISENGVICEKNKKIEQLQERIDKAVTRIKTIINIIKEQPTDNIHTDMYIIEALNSLVYILEEVKESE